MKTPEVKIDEEVVKRILNKGIDDILPTKEDFEKLLRSGKRLNVYQGFDPTGPTLHIGHTALLHKLEDIRSLGHKIYIVIGDFTARIGDPDKMSARVPLTKEQVEENMQTYREQIGKILDIDNEDNPVEFVFNSKWLEPLNFGDIIKLASEFTVQQMIKRDMFRKRMEEDKPIYIHEFMYPLMQGYDSVMLDIDVEVGGNDQMFNMLAGRAMVQNHLGKEKFVLMGKLLTTTSGEKMGKTMGNMVRLDEDPKDIYGKIMSFADDQIVLGFEILTFATLDEIESYTKRLEEGENPMILKKELALKITSELTSQEEATKAQEYFENIYQKGTEDENIEEKEISQENISIADLIVETGFAQSKSQARRLVEQGAVSVNEEKISNWDHQINMSDLMTFTLKVGRKLCKISYKQ